MPLKALRVWVTGKPSDQGYLASVAMDLETDEGIALQIRGMRLINTANSGISLVMPNIKDSKGKWQAVVSLQNSLTSKLLRDAALSEWHRLNPNYELREIFDPL
jgi:DNA-binding cell septation regulator SpoVG